VDEASTVYIYSVTQVLTTVTTVNQLLANTTGLTEEVAEANHLGRVAMFLQLQEYAKSLHKEV
jgi:hypothetical protein